MIGFIPSLHLVRVNNLLISKWRILRVDAPSGCSSTVFAPVLPLFFFLGRMQRFCAISTQKRMREEAGRFGQATTSGPAHCVFKLRRRYIKTPIICGSLAWEVLKSEQSPSTPTPLFSLSFHLSLLPPTHAAILRRTNPIMS